MNQNLCHLVKGLTVPIFSANQWSDLLHSVKNFGFCTNKWTRNKKGVAIIDNAFKTGGDEEDRTPGLGIANAALSQLSYIPRSLRDISNLKFEISNRRQQEFYVQIPRFSNSNWNPKAY